MGYVYVFEFPNGKRYVGQTMDPSTRFYCGRYRGKVREAMDLLGFKNLKKYTWEVPDYQMDDLERFLISVYKSNDPEFGYNLESGGRKGFTAAASTRYKMSQSMIGNKYNLGRKQSEEHRRSISEANKGKTRSTETRRNISESLKGKNTWTKGKPKSEETRKRMSEARKLYNEKMMGMKK